MCLLFLLYQQWTKISKSTGLLTTVHSLEWPEKRYDHAATCVSGALLVIMGGVPTSDCWIYDFTAILWKKVATCLMHFKNGSEIDLDISFLSYPSLTQ